jgi:hypothetical protein
MSPPALTNTCDGGQRLERLRAAGRRIGGHLPETGDLQLFQFELRRERAARLLRAGLVAVEEHQSGGEQGVEQDPGFGRHGPQKAPRLLISRPQPSPVLPSVAMAPRCVRRLSELMAVCTSQWLG